jgi:hypothetical protein
MQTTIIIFAIVGGFYVGRGAVRLWRELRMPAGPTFMRGGAGVRVVSGTGKRDPLWGTMIAFPFAVPARLIGGVFTMLAARAAQKRK